MIDQTFPLKRRKKIADGVVALWFDVSGVDFEFVAGQYVTIAVPGLLDESGKPLPLRSFSLASSPHEKGTVMIATRVSPMPFKTSLANIPLGTLVRIRGPFGNFVLEKNLDDPLVFLTGGIGITPIRSMTHWATSQKLSHRLTVFHSNRTRSSAPFLSEFLRWQTENPNFNFVPTLTDEGELTEWVYERGKIDEAMIKRHIADLNIPIYYVVGPPLMVAAMRELLDRLGVARDRVRFESFSGYTNDMGG